MRQAFGVSNGYAPAQGPKALPVILDFDSVAFHDIDLLLEETQGVMQNPQSVFADNSQNLNPLTLLFTGTGQRIVVPASAQGIWPLISIEQTRFRASSTVAPGLLVPLLILNVPMPLTQWGPIDVNATLSVANGNFVNRSGQLAAGGVAQNAMAANALRKRFVVSNPSSTTESLFVGFNQAATLDENSMEIMPGGAFDSNFGPVEVGNISVNAATIGHPWFAQEIS